jgi:hypothetical protein
MTEAEYRTEIHSQILDGTVMRLVLTHTNIEVSDAEIDTRKAEIEKQAPTVTRDQARDAVFNDKYARVRKEWLGKLRAQTYIEVRL